MNKDSLKERLKQRRIKIKDLAKETNTSTATMYGWIQGTRRKSGEAPGILHAYVDLKEKYDILWKKYVDLNLLINRIPR